MKSRFGFVYLLTVSALLLASCGRNLGGGSGGNTNWLVSCDAEADCGQAWACLHKVCTLACSEDRDCEELDPAAECVASACARKAGPPMTPDELRVMSLESPLPRIGACVESTLFASDEEPQPGPDFSIEGVVVDLGAGAPGDPEAGGCPYSGDVLDLGDSGLSWEDATDIAQVRWVRVQDASGEEALLAVTASGFAFPTAVGETLRIEMQAGGGGFAPEEAWLEVRDAEGTLVLWMGHSGSVDGLNTPAEIELGQGPVVFQRSDRCIPAWTENGLDVTVEETTVTLAPQEQSVVGPWIVSNGGVWVQGEGVTCPDGYAARARAAVWPTDASVPVTGGIGGPCDPELLVSTGPDDPLLTCVENTQFPLGYLTLECRTAAECPAESYCDGDLCRAPCSDDADCPPPTECLPLGDAKVCQCGQKCLEALCTGDCTSECPSSDDLGVSYFSTGHEECVDDQSTCPGGFERFDIVGCGCGCRLAPESSCAGPPLGASYTREQGGCVPECVEDELPFSDLCGCGCAPTADPAALCLPPPEDAEASYVVDPGCSPDCAKGLRPFSDACGCLCADPDAARAVCLLPAEPGPCLLSVERYYYEPLDDVCTPFTYGGCLGNLNNYPTLEACEAACVPWP